MIKVNPNRMEILRLKKRLVLCRRGHKLLKQKQDELLRILNLLIGKAGSLREEVEKNLCRAYHLFSMARAVLGDRVVEDVGTFLGVETHIEVGQKQILNLRAPEFRVRLEGDIRNYGLLMTNGDLDEAIGLFSRVIPDIVRLCEVENQIAIVSEEVEKTRRRVNALEHILIPDLEVTIRVIVMKLEELERGSRVRLMKVKEMVR